MRLRRAYLCSALWTVQPACQTQKRPSAPARSTVDEASRAHMSSRETSFVQQAEKMIAASKEYVQNTTAPTGELAGAAGQIAQKAPEELGAGMATPTLESALESAEEASKLIPDSDVPEELLEGMETKKRGTKVKSDMYIGVALLSLGGLGLAGTCFVKKGVGQGWRAQAINSLTTPTQARPSRTSTGVWVTSAALVMSGAATLAWGATHKDKGSALTAATADPAKGVYLAALAQVGVEVKRLHAKHSPSGYVCSYNRLEAARPHDQTS
jgi:hypothetical protein